MRTIYLREVRNNYYQLFNIHKDPLTKEYYFTSKEGARNWAKRWSSSWPDVVVEDKLDS